MVFVFPQPLFSTILTPKSTIYITTIQSQNFQKLISFYRFHHHQNSPGGFLLMSTASPHNYPRIYPTHPLLLHKAKTPSARSYHRPSRQTLHSWLEALLADHAFTQWLSGIICSLLKPAYYLRLVPCGLLLPSLQPTSLNLTLSRNIPYTV